MKGQVEALPCRSRGHAAIGLGTVLEAEGMEYLENRYAGHGEPSGRDKTRVHVDLGNAMNFPCRRNHLTFQPYQ